jgi:anti-sigma B factor antagonist
MSVFMEFPQGSYLVRLTLSFRQSGDVNIVDAVGRITLGEETKTLRDGLLGLIARNQKKILVNLAEVPYMDSSGIRELATAYNALKQTGGQLKLVNPNKRVEDLLKITKLHTVFDVREDEAAAIAAFG